MEQQAKDEIAALAADYLTELRSPRLAYSPIEAARLLGVDKRAVLELIHDGRLHAVKINDRVYRIPRAALYEFLGLDDPVVEIAKAAVR